MFKTREEIGDIKLLRKGKWKMKQENTEREVHVTYLCNKLVYSPEDEMEYYDLPADATFEEL